MIKVNDRLAISKKNILSVQHLSSDHKGNFCIKVTYNNDKEVFVSCGKSNEEAQKTFEKILAEADQASFSA